MLVEFYKELCQAIQELLSFSEFVDPFLLYIRISVGFHLRKQASVEDGNCPNIFNIIKKVGSRQLAGWFFSSNRITVDERLLLCVRKLMSAETINYTVL